MWTSSTACRPASTCSIARCSAPSSSSGWVTVSAHARHEIGTDEVPERASADQTDALLDSWLIADALECLSAEHRAVVICSYYRGQSVAETARLLDIPAGTVKSRLHYALRALRLALQERGVTER